MSLKPITKVILVLAGLAFIAGGVVVYRIGPRNIIGMLRYDQRREGTLKVGDKAPDLNLLKLDGTGQANLIGNISGKPLILIFGSYT